MTTVDETIAAAARIVTELDPPPAELLANLRDSLRAQVLAEGSGVHYGLIVGITDKGTVDILVRRWPYEPCIRALQKAVLELEYQHANELVAIEEDAAFERELDARAGGGW